MAVIAGVGIAVTIGGALMGYGAQKAAAQAQLIEAKGRAEASNITMKADNEYKASSASLTNFLRAQQNKRIMEAAGNQYKAMSQNIVRVMDQATSDSVSRRLRYSEQFGQMVAAASAAGVGGGSVDAINSTMKRVQDVSEQEIKQKNKVQLGDMINQQNNIINNSVAQMDNSTTFANIDYSKAKTPFIAQPSLIGALASGVNESLPYVKQLMDHYDSLKAGSSGAKIKN